MLFGMQFNEQELHQMREACIKFQQYAGSSFQIREYDNLIRKIDKYTEQYSCDDCCYCEIHRPDGRSLSQPKTSDEQPFKVASNRYSSFDVVGTAD